MSTVGATFTNFDNAFYSGHTEISRGFGSLQKSSRGFTYALWGKYFDRREGTG